MRSQGAGRRGACALRFTVFIEYVQNDGAVFADAAERRA